MENNSKLWPINQLLEWFDTCDKKYCLVPAKYRPTLIAMTKFCPKDSWKCWPSIKRLSNITGKSERSIIRDIQGMEKLSIISTKVRFDKLGDRDNNLYTIHPENFWGVLSKCQYGSDKMSLGYCQNVTLINNSTSNLNKKKGFVHKNQPRQANGHADVSSQSTAFVYDVSPPRTIAEQQNGIRQISSIMDNLKGIGRQ